MRVRVKSPAFLSELDEELFFLGLRLAPSVRSYRGVGQHLVLTVSAGTDASLDALLRRFGTTAVLLKPRESRRRSR